MNSALEQSRIEQKTKKLLADRIRANRVRICEWYHFHGSAAPPPFYCSVDLRDSGHKIVPVDSNLYPAGFNNICPDDQRTAPHVIRAQIELIASRLQLAQASRILILPESHTSNRWYLENLYYLRQILVEGGFDVRIGWYGELPPGGENGFELLSATQKAVQLFPLRIEGGQAKIEGFVPDLILLNNDFSSGYPKPLDDVTQPILPSHTLGWHTRKKTEHFRHYNRLAAEFAEILDIDPWIIQVDTEEVTDVDFDQDHGIDRVAESVSRLLDRTRAAYKRHRVEKEPFVFVKNNAGTYGMGIMVVHSAEEILKMNRRSKNKMAVGKNKLKVQSVAVQEGIPTLTVVDRLVAEPVIYLIGTELIGGFLRTNTDKGDEDNLNSQGMVFRKLCMSDLWRPEDDEAETPEEEEPILELVYGAIARISALATGYELAAHVRK